MKEDYLATRSGQQVWTYLIRNHNPDPCSKPKGAGAVSQGNDRVVCEVKDGRRRFILYANAKAPGQTYLDFPIKFPYLFWAETKTPQINAAAVRQGIITQAEVDYFNV